jgi:O-antigen ligase
VFSFSDYWKYRVISIVTSVYYEDAKQSTGNRIELWKGSLMLFRESPVFGKGSGDYQANINRLVQEKKLKQMTTTFHAHNIFFQTIATQGAIGLLVLIGFLSTLLRWGINSIRTRQGVGGYIIIYCTLLTAFSGFTDFYFGSIHYFSACYVTIGLLGAIGSTQKKHDVQHAAAPFAIA